MLSILTFDDLEVIKVERKGNTADKFLAHFSSKQLKKYQWTENSKVTVEITYEDMFDKATTYNYKVTNYKKVLLFETVEFEEE